MSDKIFSYTNFKTESSVRPELRIEESTATLLIEHNKIFDIQCTEPLQLIVMLEVYIDIFKDARHDLVQNLDL